MISENHDRVADLLVRTCKDYEFDGLVIEFWFQLSGRIKDGHLITLIENIGIIQTKIEKFTREMGFNCSFFQLQP